MSLTLGTVAFDCLDVTRTATFWSHVLERPLDPGASEFFAAIGMDGEGPGWLFLGAEPRATGKNPVHVDLVDPDYPAQVERVVALGAERVGDFDEYGVQWTTLLDPEGNAFDIGRRHP
ncbi:VOC family protein [Agilicoccus flavus]|uniref:VOC family protein n=1 Tax=Agilicoccus flavus TaxID=2775968 RepID=UPI001CF6969C|nr:VOC family protein [Agilicoccus flavus]